MPKVAEEDEVVKQSDPGVAARSGMARWMPLNTPIRLTLITAITSSHGISP